MPFLLPQLRQLASDYDGTRPLPKKLERVARLVADAEWTQGNIARACRISHDSVTRLKRQPHFAVRVQFLRNQAAERAAKDAPLAYRGNRIAMLDKHARRLAEDLEKNGYTDTVATTKQGVPIEGFDRGRAAELVKTVMALEELTEGRRSAIADTTKVDVSVTMTTADAVTRVQALLSRADPGNPPAGPQGWRGVSSETESVREDGAVLDTEYTTILDAKAVEVKRDAE